MKRLITVAISMVLLAGLIGCSDSANEIAELRAELAEIKTELEEIKGINLHQFKKFQHQKKKPKRLMKLSMKTNQITPTRVKMKKLLP